MQQTTALSAYITLEKISDILLEVRACPFKYQHYGHLQCIQLYVHNVDIYSICFIFSLS